MPKNKNFLRVCGIGFFLLAVTTPVYAFDTAVVDWAIGELCGHISGHLGGLLVTVAGFGAIVAAAMGSYRVFYGAIITAVGAFATSTIMGLYFPEAANVCDGGGGGGGNQRAVQRVAPAQAETTRGNDPFETFEAP